MYHLRLIKALSYSGAVSATADHPDVFTDDEQKYQRALASGYFEAVSVPDGGAGNVQIPNAGSGVNMPGMGIDAAGEKTGQNPPDVKADQDAEASSFADMNVTELKAYAALNGIDISGLKKRDEIEAQIRASEARAAEARAALREE